MRTKRGSVRRTAVVTLLVGLGLLGLLGSAAAQDFPTKSISIVVGTSYAAISLTPPGGA